MSWLRGVSWLSEAFVEASRRLKAKLKGVSWLREAQRRELAQLARKALPKRPP